MFTYSKEYVETFLAEADLALDRAFEVLTSAARDKEGDATAKETLEEFGKHASDNVFLTFCTQIPELQQKLDKLKARRDKFLEENPDSEALQKLQSELSESGESNATASRGTESSGTT